MWCGHQRRSAARDETNQQVIFAEAACQFEGFLPGEQTVLVGDGMSTGLEVESAWGVDGSLFWNEQAAGRVTREQVRQGQGHGRAGLPQSEDAHLSDFVQRIFLPVDEKGIVLAADKLPNRRPRFDGSNGRGEDAADGFAARVAG
jgi:hypothetical protein